MNVEENRPVKLTAVTKANPCPVCAGDHKCAVADGGLILCGRANAPVPGFRHLGPSKGDPQFHLCRREDGPAPKGAKKPVPSKNWDAVARACAAGFNNDARAELATRLEPPAPVFEYLSLVGVSGRTDAGRTFSFPERSFAGGRHRTAQKTFASG